MEAILNLQDLLTHEIDDLYSAEEQIIEALPKMAEKASDQELKKALNQHLKITVEQKKRLDKVRTQLKGKENNNEKKGLLERIFGSSTKCKGTEGLISEGEKIMGEDLDEKVMDAAIIASAQKIEHYEISGYGTARAYARELGLSQVEKLLETTLNEEYTSDLLLTSLALSKVNVEAEKGGNSSSDEGRKTAPKKTGGKSPSKKSASAKNSSAKKAAPKKANKKSAKRSSR